MSARHPLRRKATAVPESYSPGVLAAIAFCPSPPLLVPELAAGAAAELDPLRAACAGAVRRLLDAAPDELVVLGTGPVTSWFPAPAGMSRLGRDRNLSRGGKTAPPRTSFSTGPFAK